MVVTDNKKLTRFPVNQYKVDYNSWPIDWLANYIEKKQRRSIIEASKIIRHKLSLISRMHGNYGSDLLQMERLFNESVKHLYEHMKKEEAGLFPFIRELVLAKELGQGINRPVFAKIEAAIMLLIEDHKKESQRLNWIAEINHNHTVLGNCSKMHKALFTMFREFKEELELHIFLQSKFLFPKIISMKYAVI